MSDDQSDNSAPPPLPQDGGAPAAPAEPAPAAEQSPAAPEAAPPEVAPAPEPEVLATSKFENRFVGAYDEENKPSAATESIGEMMDREERKRIEAEKAKEEAERQKLLNKKKKKKRTPAQKEEAKAGDETEEQSSKISKKKKSKVPEDKIEAALKAGRMKDVKKRKVKKYGSIAGAFVGIFLFYQLYVFLFAYPIAPKAFSICRTYLELKVRYPQYLDFISMSQYKMSLRIWYTRIDAFGARRLEEMRCYLKRDEVTGGLIISEVSVDRREERSDKIAAYNKVLPVLMMDMPEYEYPRFKGDKDTSNITVDVTAVRSKAQLN